MAGTACRFKNFAKKWPPFVKFDRLETYRRPKLIDVDHFLKLYRWRNIDIVNSIARNHLPFHLQLHISENITWDEARLLQEWFMLNYMATKSNMGTVQDKALFDIFCLK